jgi:PAS domain S-box-containing protein
MNNWLNEICGTGFMPHGQCYQWSPWLIWLHALSDSLITLAYFSIPAALVYFAHKRRDLPHRNIFLLFGSFIIACGTTHALEVWTIWHPHYVLTGTVKLLTALISVATAIGLYRILPHALRLPSQSDLRQSNEQLETRIRERTADLATANSRLQQEVSQREQAENEVRRLNSQLERRVRELQTLFDVLPVGVGVAEDPACRVVRTNVALANMLRLPAGRNASLTATDQRPDNFRVLHQNQPVAPTDLPMQVAARENRSVRDFEETIEYSDGSRIEVLANAIPLRDEQGAAVGCVATFQNITPLKAASEADARYAAIVASSEDAIIGKTIQGIVTSWNHGAEQLFGYTQAEMLGQPISRLFPPDRLDEEPQIIARLLQGTIVPQFDTVRLRKDGQTVHVAITLSLIRTTSGRIIGTSLSARDITARRRATDEKVAFERKLLETQKLESLGVLAGGIAHDFNNLLTGILGNSSLARMELPRTSSIVPMLDQIEIATQRAADLCKQMLAYSGKGRFVVQPLNLNTLIEETMHLLAISISKTCVTRFNLLPELPATRADATQIRQIIMNLVINASEAIGARSGVIALSTGVVRVDPDYIATLMVHDHMTPGDYVFLEVSDNGIGMEPAILAKIFDPFFTTKFTGRGLGLAAVLGIIRGHQGGMKVYSERGRGTTFKVLLPCADGVVPSAGGNAPSGDRPWRGQGTVLIVDDEETVRTVSARMVEALGFQSVLASDGREAVALYRAEPARFNLVLLDLTMPHLDGEETFRQLRHINPGVKVILMSGFNQEEAVSRFTGKGLAGFVQKPFEVANMLAIIRAAFMQS